MICYEEDERLTNQQTKVISTAIQRMYDSVGVTDKKDTWIRSKGLRLKCVYDEIKDMALSKEFFTADGSNSMNEAVESILEATSVFFEEERYMPGHW